MKPASRFLVGSLPVLTLLVSGMAMAGGGYNSTSPAMGTVQLASILCNVSSGSSPQGYVRNNSLNGAVGGTHLRRSGLCRSLAAQHSSQNHKGKHKAIGHHYGREISRTPNHNRVATNAVGQHKSRDSFKQETWFMPDGSKQRRVTKHQARKQGWTGPEAMQAAHQSSLDVIASPTDEALMAQRQSSDSPADSAQSVSRLVPAMASLVTDGARYDSVETGLYKRQGQAPVPFKMVRNHGVIAIPQFEPGSDSAVASAEPTILVKKFRMVDGVMQPDNSFSDDGMEDFAVPLPAGDRVTAFTLDKDKLVVLSRPEADQGLSRVTLINIDESDDAEMIDGGASSGLWVKGELFRFHDDALYTVSQEEQKLFIYPDLASDSSQSLSSVRVVDLSSVGLADGELVSALADGERCHVAVRRPDPGSDGQKIHLYQMDDGGAPSKETLVTDVGAQDDGYQLHFVEGSLTLSPVPSVNPDIGQLAFPDAADEELASHEPGARIQKRSAVDEDYESVAGVSMPVVKRQSTACGTGNYSNIVPMINCGGTKEFNCSCTSETCNTGYTCGSASASGAGASVGGCTSAENWTWSGDQCWYNGTASCAHIVANLFSPSSISSCRVYLTSPINVSLSREACIGENRGNINVTFTRNPPDCALNSQKPTGPMAVLVAVSAGLSAAALTTGFAGFEGKKRSEHDEPMEQDDNPAQM